MGGVEVSGGVNDVSEKLPPRNGASAFGDTDGEFFGQIFFRPNVASTTVDAEVFFFEMLSWGGLDRLGNQKPPGISVTRALPPGGSGGLRPPRPPHDNISKKKTSKNIIRKINFEQCFSKNIYRTIFFEKLFDGRGFRRHYFQEPIFKKRR